MKQINRILASLLCLTLFLALLPGIPAAFAETADVPTITLSGVVGEPDKDAVVPVDLSENPGLMAMLFEISYDHTLLTLTGIRDGGLTGWELSGDHVLWLGEGDSTYNGTIFSLTFHVAAAAEPGDLPVTLLCNSGDVGNHEEESFLPKITAGNIHLHGWGVPTYTWAADNHSVTAQRVCSVDGTHVETETVDTTGEVTTEATCLGAGKTTYTAAFTNPAFETQTKTVPDIEPTGHAYELTGWTWTGYTAAVATFTCKNDASHVQTVNGTITSVRNEPTADANGSVVYTATATFEGQTYTDVKTEVLPALGRDYELTGWTWTDYTAAAATFTDKNGSGDVTVNATITSVRTEPTCESAGQVVYTATVTFEGQDYTDVKTETLPALGHDYALTSWTWTGYTAAVASFTCKNDLSHVQTVNGTITGVRTEPTADANGSVVYTATAVFEGQTFTDTRTEILPALGREYVFTGWTWTDYTAAAATFTDKNGSGAIEVPAVITSVRTEPACETAGKVVYTATVTFQGQTYTDTKTETLSALGHDLIHHEAQAPTCTEIGWEAYDTCSRCDYTTYVELAAIGHNWGEPTYEWTEDNSTVTATRICKNDQSHVETEKAETTSEVTKEATYAAEGEITYTAVFENTAFETQTKVVATPKLGDPCEGYDDVERDSWYHPAADYVISIGIMGSTSQTELHFEPYTKVSRAMVASILYRICGAPADVEYKGTFTDVPKDQWFATAVEWCAQNGLASGKGGGIFDPNGNVTRQELAVFMYKLADYLEKDVTQAADLSAFPDGSTVPDWAAAYMKWAVGAGLITGKGQTDGTTLLAPTDTAMRCELASILQRFLS